jgi:hypothetical protein
MGPHPNHTPPHRYRADWRDDTLTEQFFDTGGILSLRGTSGATKAGIRRLKKLPEAERPDTEHFGTIRRHAYEAHYIQRAKALTNTFAIKRSVVQWDEATINHLAWCVIILVAVRCGNVREREVLSTSKLKPDSEGMSKTGVGVGGANITALDCFEVPVENIDFCCSDTTASNSSLHLPRKKGGSGGKGGAYVLWEHTLSPSPLLPSPLLPPPSAFAPHMTLCSEAPRMDIAPVLKCRLSESVAAKTAGGAIRGPVLWASLPPTTPPMKPHPHALWDPADTPWSSTLLL